MRALAGCLSFFGIIAILAVLALGVGYVLLSLTPPLKELMQPVSLSSEAVQSLNNKLKVFQASIDDAMKANEERLVSLTITEEEANSKIIEVLAEETMPVKEVLFNFRESNVLGYAVLNTPVLNAKVAVLATVEISKGKPKIIAQDIDLGKLPIPTSLANSGASYILRLMTDLITVPGDLPWDTTSVNVADGKIIVSGISQKPKKQ